MILRLIARTISLIFHPLLILTYMLVFLIWANPYVFGGGGYSKNFLLILYVLLYTFAMPALCLLMMRLTGLVNSLELPERQDRCIPFIAAGVFYCWLSVNAYHTSMYPKFFTAFVIGSTISLFLAFFINLFQKISIHTVGMGGLVAMVLITLLYHSYENIQIYLLASILLAGVVGTARLILKAHSAREVYSGYFWGFLGQLLALLWF